MLSGTAFTAPRAENLSTWMYRLRPSAMHAPFRRMGNGLLRSGPFDEVETPFNRLRWDPLPLPEAPTDFLDGLITLAGSGDAAAQSGIAVHVYRANRSMTERTFCNADGEMMFVPQQGEILLFTELGRLTVAPGEIAVIPRGMKFKRRDCARGACAATCARTTASPSACPSSGRSARRASRSARHFLTPVAAYEDRDAHCEVVTKFMGGLWAHRARAIRRSTSSPGTGATRRTSTTWRCFMAVNTVTVDHADPSIFTVLTSPSGQPGTANCDFVIFPPRWMVAEHTFRPPWFHRNLMSELMGLVRGVYDAKAEGFVPGGVSLHNCMAAHGPDVDDLRQGVERRARARALQGHARVHVGVALRVPPDQVRAWTRRSCRRHYDAVWDGFRKPADLTIMGSDPMWISRSAQRRTEGV